MNKVRITASKAIIKRVESKMSQARNAGDYKLYLRAQVILCVFKGLKYSFIKKITGISEETIRLWLTQYIEKGVKSFKTNKSPGRPAKLTKKQKSQLKKAIIKGPTALGYLSACWRSPMIQDYIKQTFGIFYSVKYISELLKNLGLSFQKAKFVSDHLDEEKRKTWLRETWSEIVKISQERNAHIMFGDEVSFPQWGTLSYTWAEKGKTPIIKTSGKRKGYKVFGLIEYWTGKLFYKSQEGRLESSSYIEFLKEVISSTKGHIILIQDGARYHTSKMVKEFFEENRDRLTVFQLPSYSPDYNPIEKLWKKIKEGGTHLTHFPTFENLKDKVNQTLLAFKNKSKEILSLCNLYDELIIGAR